MKKGFLVSLLVVIFSFLSLAGIAAFAQVSFAVSPLITELTIPAGTTREFPLIVFTSSGEKKEMHFRVYVTDFNLKRDGSIQFFRPASLKRSAAPWVEINPSEFVMKSGGAKQVKVKLAVPRGISGGYYASIMVELVPEIPPEAVMGVVRTWRMVSLVELTVTGWKKLQERVKISELRVQPGPEEKGFTFTTTVENQGDVHVRGEGELIIKTKGGRIVESLTLKAGRGMIFPNRLRDFKAVLDKKLPAGDYFVEAVFNYGDKKWIRAKISFSPGRMPVKGEELAKREELSFSVEPSLLEVETPPGSFRTLLFTISNEEHKPVYFQIFVKDVSIEADGKTIPLEQGTTSWSCAQWIDFKISDFELGPASRQKVVATLKVPKGVSGGRYAKLMVRASLTGSKTSEKDSTVIPETTIGVVIPGSLDRQGKIVKFDVLRDDNSSSEFLVSFKNTGNVHLKVKGGVIIKDHMDETIAELAFSDGEVMVLPEGTRNFTAACSKELKAGRYNAEARLYYGGEETATIREEFTVK